MASLNPGNFSNKNIWQPKEWAGVLTWYEANCYLFYYPVDFHMQHS